MSLRDQQIRGIIQQVKKDVSAGMTQLSDDVTPSLGGNLDGDSHDMTDMGDITSSGTIQGGTLTDGTASLTGGTASSLTITSPVLNTGVSGTAVKDEDNMVSDSDTHLATQQSIKAYTDTKLANVVEDTTPQLGGDLDLNGNNIDFPSVANISDCKDEDNMASDSATMLATQQSIKAYADALDRGEGHINILAYNYESIGQGTWSITTYATQALNYYFHNNTHADGDNLSWKVYLTAGTYTLRILALKNTAYGIIDIDIDAVEVASFDLYNAGGLQANQIFTQTNISISTSGLKTLKLRLDGKNAGSTNYYALFNSITLWRTV